MKIGIFGGTFDPLHNQHAELIRRAREALALDKVLLVPTYMPPHKKTTSTPYEERVEMLNAFTRSVDYVEIDESERECGSSYACDVLKFIAQKYNGADIYYLIGGDSLIRFDSWKNPDLILKTVKLRVAGRGTRDDIPALCNKIQNKYGGDVKYLFDCKEESSGTVRLDVIFGNTEAVRASVPKPVFDYISTHNLYSEYRATVNKLKNTVSPNLFLHCMAVAEYAVEHSWQVWESFDRAFYAGLLHDCAKGREVDFRGEIPEDTAPEVIHQYAGAVIAKEEFSITDDAVLDAIRYHTTAKPEMSRLGKLVYIADKLEKRRSYPGVEKLREAVNVNFEDGFISTLEHGYEFLLTKNCTPDVLTLRACAWYNIDTKR